MNLLKLLKPLAPIAAVAVACGVYTGAVHETWAAERTAPRVAIVGRYSEDSSRTAKIRILLETMLSKKAEVQVVERTEIRHIFEELNRQKLFSSQTGPDKTAFWNALSGVDMFALLESLTGDSGKGQPKSLRVRLIDAHVGTKHADLTLPLHEEQTDIDKLVGILSRKIRNHALSRADTAKDQPLVALLPFRCINADRKWLYVQQTLTSALEHRLCLLPDVRVMEHTQAGILHDERKLTNDLPEIITAVAVLVDGEFEVEPRRQRVNLHLRVRAKHLDKPKTLRFQFGLEELADMSAKIMPRLLNVIAADKVSPTVARYAGKTEAQLLLQEARLQGNPVLANRLAESALAIAPDSLDCLYDFLDFAYHEEYGKRVESDKVLARRARDAFFKLMSRQPDPNDLTVERTKILYACAGNVHPFQSPQVDADIGMPFLGMNRYVVAAVQACIAGPDGPWRFTRGRWNARFVSSVLRSPERWSQNPHDMLRLIKWVGHNCDRSYFYAAANAWKYFCSADRCSYEGGKYRQAREAALKFFHELSDSENSARAALGQLALLTSVQHQPDASDTEKRRAFEAYARVYTDNSLWKDKELCTSPWLNPFYRIADEVYRMDREDRNAKADYLRRVAKGILKEHEWLKGRSSRIRILAEAVLCVHQAGRTEEALNLAEDVVEAVKTRSANDLVTNMRLLRSCWRDLTGKPFSRLINKGMEAMLLPGKNNKFLCHEVFAGGGRNIVTTDNFLVIIRRGKIIRLDTAAATFEPVEKQSLPSGYRTVRTGRAVTEEDAVCVQIKQGLAVFVPGHKPFIYDMSEQGLNGGQIIGFDILNGIVYVILSTERGLGGETLIAWHPRTNEISTILSIHKDLGLPASLPPIRGIREVVADRFRKQLRLLLNTRDSGSVMLEYHSGREAFGKVEERSFSNCRRRGRIVYKAEGCVDYTFTDIKTGIEMSRVRIKAHERCLPEYFQARSSSSPFHNPQKTVAAGRGVLTVRSAILEGGRTEGELPSSAVLFYTPPVAPEDSQKLFGEASGQLSERYLGRHVVILNHLLFAGLEHSAAEIRSMQMTGEGLLILTDSRLLLSPGMAQFYKNAPRFSQKEIRHACRLYTAAVSGLAGEPWLKKVLRRHFGGTAVDWLEANFEELIKQTNKPNPDFWNVPRSNVALFQEGRLLFRLGEALSTKGNVGGCSTANISRDYARKITLRRKRVYGMLYKHYLRSPWRGLAGYRYGRILRSSDFGEHQKAQEVFKTIMREPTKEYVKGPRRAFLRGMTFRGDFASVRAKLEKYNIDLDNLSNMEARSLETNFYPIINTVKTHLPYPSCVRDTDLEALGFLVKIWTAIKETKGVDRLTFGRANRPLVRTFWDWLNPANPKAVEILEEALTAHPDTGFLLALLIRCGETQHLEPFLKWLSKPDERHDADSAKHMCWLLKRGFISVYKFLDMPGFMPYRERIAKALMTGLNESALLPIKLSYINVLNSFTEYPEVQETIRRYAEVDDPELRLQATVGLSSFEPLAGLRNLREFPEDTPFSIVYGVLGHTQVALLDRGRNRREKAKLAALAQDCAKLFAKRIPERYMRRKLWRAGIYVSKQRFTKIVQGAPKFDLLELARNERPENWLWACQYWCMDSQHADIEAFMSLTEQKLDTPSANLFRCVYGRKTHGTKIILPDPTEYSFIYRSGAVVRLAECCHTRSFHDAVYKMIKRWGTKYIVNNLLSDADNEGALTNIAKIVRENDKLQSTFQVTSDSSPAKLIVSAETAFQKGDIIDARKKWKWYLNLPTPEKSCWKKSRYLRSPFVQFRLAATGLGRGINKKNGDNTAPDNEPDITSLLSRVWPYREYHRKFALMLQSAGYPEKAWQAIASPRMRLRAALIAVQTGRYNVAQHLLSKTAVFCKTHEHREFVLSLRQLVSSSSRGDLRNILNTFFNRQRKPSVRSRALTEAAEECADSHLRAMAYYAAASALLEEGDAYREQAESLWKKGATQEGYYAELCRRECNALPKELQKAMLTPSRYTPHSLLRTVHPTENRVVITHKPGTPQYTSASITWRDPLGIPYTAYYKPMHFRGGKGYHIPIVGHVPMALPGRWTVESVHQPENADAITTPPRNLFKADSKQYPDWEIHPFYIAPMWQPGSMEP